MVSVSELDDRGIAACLLTPATMSGLSVFRNLDTIGKGANLTIHCLSRSLERFRLRNKKYPEVLYLQVVNIILLFLCSLHILAEAEPSNTV